MALAFPTEEEIRANFWKSLGETIPLAEIEANPMSKAAFEIMLDMQIRYWNEMAAIWEKLAPLKTPNSEDIDRMMGGRKPHG